MGDTPLVIRIYSNSEIPTLNMPPDFSVNHNVPDIELLQEVFNISDPKYRGVVNLIAEAQFPSLPDHYKVLSLVRALELMTPKGQQLGDILDKYQDQYIKIGISNGKFRSALPQIRNRCAHGLSNKSTESMVAAVCSEIAYLGHLVLLLRQISSDLFKDSFGIYMYVDLGASPMPWDLGAGGLPPE